MALAKAESAEVVIKDPGAPTFAEAERLVREKTTPSFILRRSPYLAWDGGGGIGTDGTCRS